MTYPKGGAAAELVLPWPAAALSPNARGHWAVKARAAKIARITAYLLTIEAGWRNLQLPPEGKLRLVLEFYPPTAQRVDDDNMVGRMKPARDGIADALGIDDGRFRSVPEVMDEVRKGGEVRVRLVTDTA